MSESNGAALPPPYVSTGLGVWRTAPSRYRVEALASGHVVIDSSPFPLTEARAFALDILAAVAVSEKALSSADGAATH